jgi:hypothetical protein
MQSVSEAGYGRQPTATHHCVGVRRSGTVRELLGHIRANARGLARGWPPPDGRDGRQSTVAEDRTGTASGTRRLGSPATTQLAVNRLVWTGTPLARTAGVAGWDVVRLPLRQFSGESVVPFPLGAVVCDASLPVYLSVKPLDLCPKRLRSQLLRNPTASPKCYLKAESPCTVSSGRTITRRMNQITLAPLM